MKWCRWLAPAPGELRHNEGLPSDGPSAYERATITSVASGTLQALGTSALGLRPMGALERG